jgi:RNA polymerase sigma-70 factor (ECF subfamily)
MELCATMSEQTTDWRMIAACQEGDREAFRQLFETYKDRVYSIALHFSGDEASARDITQQVFLKLLTRVGQFRHDADFTTWLYRLVTNTCLDELRRRKRFVPYGDVTEVSHMMVEKESQEDHYSQRELSDAVRAAIAALKPKLRLPLLLKYVEGLSYDEIAGALGCSKGTVASRLNRGHKILARKLAHLRGAFIVGE